MQSSFSVSNPAVLSLACLVALGAGCGGTRSSSGEKSKTQKVVELLESIESGEAGPAAAINPTNYTQHNLGVADGIEGFGAVLAQLPEGSARVNVVRVFEDGDFVFAHTEYNFFGPKIGFDIFRFEDGLIVEHWDNLQETPPSANPSGHTMIDGPTTAKDLDQSAANKALVRSFVDDVLVNGKMNTLPQYFSGDVYTQHNPQIADGLSGLGAALEAMAKQGITMKYDTIHKVLGQGDFVLVTSEGKLADAHTAFYDLFRVADGKIVEHWDTVETIPAQAEWKNENGKF